MDPSLPSTLMPLVCPYLSYEDTVRCMQLNSSFNRYIDDNWKYMTKENINLEICLVERENNSWFDVKFSHADAYRNTRNPVHIDKTSIEITEHDIPFFKSFLRKHAPHNTNASATVFTVDDEFQGLKLVLDCFVRRFALNQVEINFSNTILTHHTAALEVIGSSLEYHYPPKIGDVTWNFEVSLCVPYLNDLVKKLKIVKYSIGRLGAALDIGPLETTNVAIFAWTSLWSTCNISDFLKEWLAGKRGIMDLKYELCQIDYRNPKKRIPIFKELCQSSGIDDHSETSDLKSGNGPIHCIYPDAPRMPYLSYEDTVRCMQLNSNFNRYIDENWKYMTKQEIDLDIYLESSEHEGTTDVYFNKFGYFGTISVCIDETYIEITRNQILFLRSFLRKHVSRDNGICMGAVFDVTSKVEGLKLVLDCLARRCALCRVKIVSSNASNNYRSAALEAIGRSLEHYYPPKTGFETWDFIVSDCEPYLNTLVRTLKLKKYYISASYGTMPDLIPLETANVVINASTYIWSANHISNFLKVWIAGERGIMELNYHLCQMYWDTLERKPIFKELCQSLGIDSDNETSDHTSGSRKFQLHRADGKILHVTHYLRLANFNERPSSQIEYFRMYEI